MLNLDAYSMAALQQTLGLLREAQGEAMTLEAVVETLAQAVAQVVVASPITPPSTKPEPQRPANTHCPHCGSPLVPVANPDGLRIIGCKRCRYSRIMDTQGAQGGSTS